MVTTNTSRGKCSLFTAENKAILDRVSNGSITNGEQFTTVTKKYGLEIAVKTTDELEVEGVRF